MITLVVISALCIYRFSRPNAVDRFWKPILSADASPLICLSDLGQFTSERTNTQSIWLESALEHKERLLALPDVVALTRVSSILAMRVKPALVQDSVATTVVELRQQPDILIGGLNNQWTVRAMQFMPFQIAHGDENRIVGIRDTNDASKLRWVAVLADTANPYQKTYSIVARFHDPTTGQPTMVIAGISSNGTTAATEFVTTPAYLKTFTDRAPRGWEDKNIEIVLETQIINNDNGPPHIVATHLW